MRKFEFVSANQFAEAVTDVLNTYEKNIEYAAVDPSNFKLPCRATKLSAGYDIFSPFTFCLMPGEEIKVPTGIKAFMNDGEVLLIYPRSGLGFKYYERLANCVGVIDADYVNSDNEGHIFVKIRNDGTKRMIIKTGEAFCQAIFTPFLLVDGDDFETGEDRNGGFGSTTKTE